MRAELADQWMNAAITPTWQKLYMGLVDASWVGEGGGAKAADLDAGPHGKLEPAHAAHAPSSAGSSAAVKSEDGKRAKMETASVQATPLCAAVKTEGGPRAKMETASVKSEQRERPVKRMKVEEVIHVDTPPCTPPRKQRDSCNVSAPTPEHQKPPMPVVAKARPALPAPVVGVDVCRTPAFESLAVLLDDDGAVGNGCTEMVQSSKKRNRTCKSRVVSVEDQVLNESKRYMAEIGITWQHSQSVRSRPRP